MAYRSERFEVGELEGLGQVFATLNWLESRGLEIENEIMAGSSYRRQLHEDTVKSGHDVNYLLQATLQAPMLPDGRRYKAKYFVEESARVLQSLNLPGLVLPGKVTVDVGAFKGMDPPASELPFGSTGNTEQDILQVYPPWLKAEWSEAGKSCLFFCGILPPQPKSFMEDYHFDWDERIMRAGRIAFKPTPSEVTALN